MIILAGIDGTGGEAIPGSGRDARYDIDFANSFVTKIARVAKPGFGYWRGPVMLGGGLMGAINGAFNFIEQKVRTTRGMTSVLLTGYSRGGAGVVSVAKKLKDAGIDVSAMLLFDPVDRYLFADAEVIPTNVKNVLHLTRDSKSGSRESFSNDAMRYHPSSTKLDAYKFMCTHGGLGGVPWTIPTGGKSTDIIDEGGVDGATNITYGEDKSMSDFIWNFIQPFCKTHGFL